MYEPQMQFSLPHEPRGFPGFCIHLITFPNALSSSLLSLCCLVIQAAKEKKAKLGNPNFFVSKTRCGVFIRRMLCVSHFFLRLSH